MSAHVPGVCVVAVLRGAVFAVICQRRQQPPVGPPRVPACLPDLSVDQLHSVKAVRVPGAHKPPYVDSSLQLEF